MKKKNFPQVLFKSVAVLCCIIMISVALLLSSFSTAKLNDDVWKMLGVTKQKGSEKIKNSFMNGYLDHYGLKNIKNVALNNRAAITKDLLAYTKEFINSHTFKKEYDQMRADAKPSEPEKKALRTIEQIQKDEIAKTEKSIKDAEKTIKELPDMAKALNPVLDMFRKNLKEYQDPKHKYFSAIAQGEQYDQQNEIRGYNERMKKWEDWYPASIKDFVAEKLQKMLKTTEGIDYTADLVEKWGKKRFANPAYESKSQEWKQGFRAGKEVTETARTFAQKWLDELKGK